MGKYKQKAIDVNFPYEVEAWKIGEKVPEWLSDRAKVEWIDGEGNISIVLEETNTGGVIVVAAGPGQESLVRLKSRSDMVIFPLLKNTPQKLFPCLRLPAIPRSRQSIFSLSREDFEKMYENLISE